jgi:hypothetical protein
MIPLYLAIEQAALRDPLYLFLPLLVSGAFTALVLTVQSLAGLLSDRDQRFQKHQSVSKGAS